MSTIYYEVNDIDVSDEVQRQSLTINHRLTSSVDTAVFTMVDPDTAPVPGNSVLIYLDNATQKLFAGLIVSINQRKLAPGSWQYTVNCTDWQRLFDKRLVATTYTSKTVQQIVEDIVSNYTDATVGFTSNNVTGVSFITINEMRFNYRYPSDCLRELAESHGCEWYIDEDKDVHFFVKQEVEDAPYEITDTTLKTVINTFNISIDYYQVRNTVYVRGGYKLSSSITETRVADGSQRTWNLPYKPYSLSLTVDGGAKTLGEEFIDEDDGSYEYFYNYDEKIVKCATAEATPAQGILMVFSFTFERPILIYATDDASINEIADAELGDGKYEYIYKDTNLNESEAFIRAKYELQINKDPVISGSFTSHEYGFKVGQTLAINFIGCDYNDDYGINNVTITSLGNNILLYSMEFTN